VMSELELAALYLRIYFAGLPAMMLEKVRLEPKNVMAPPIPSPSHNPNLC